MDVNLFLVIILYPGLINVLIIICVIATCPEAGLKKVKTLLDGYKMLVNKNEVTK